MDTRSKGRDGENIAADYLLSNGYTIVERNYQTRYGEIDIIARSPDGTLVFAEVKAALSARCGDPLFKVTPAKQRKLINLAKFYMHRYNITGRPCRMDVIGITNGKVDHLQNAFWAW